MAELSDVVKSIKIRNSKPVEGKHFVFYFSADYTRDNDTEYPYEPGLAIFKVKQRKLNELWHPCDDVKSGEDADGEAINYLTKNKIKEVYTLSAGRRINPIRRFLGLTLHWNNKFSWGDYDRLRPEDWKKTLTSIGIQLILVDYEP